SDHMPPSTLVLVNATSLLNASVGVLAMNDSREAADAPGVMTVLVPVGVPATPDTTAPPTVAKLPTGVLVRLHVSFALRAGSNVAWAWSMLVFVMAAS